MNDDALYQRPVGVEQNGHWRSDLFDPPHLQIGLNHQGERVWVDQGVAGFIVQLWELGIVTYYSCQGGMMVLSGGKTAPFPAYVVFKRSSARSLKLVLALLHPSVEVAGVEEIERYPDRLCVRWWTVDHPPAWWEMP